MATLVVSLLPTNITEDGNETVVAGEIRFNGGNYVTGGVQAVWDYTDTPSANFSVLKRTGQAHVGKEPKIANLRCGSPKFALNPIVVKGSPLPKIQVFTVSSNAEATNGAALDSSMQSTTPPPFPHWFEFRYKKNI